MAGREASLLCKTIFCSPAGLFAMDEHSPADLARNGR
jgi:hypothetical protein